MVKAVAKRRHLGFTLVEMLVVVAVVILLLGLVLVGTRTVVEAGRATTCLNDMRNIGAAVLSYTNASGGQYPISSHTTASLTSPQSWLQSLENLGIAERVRWCPDDPFCE